MPPLALDDEMLDRVMAAAALLPTNGATTSCAASLIESAVSSWHG
jgi:hypothetical protein